jgi:hypothetical protein
MPPKKPDPKKKGGAAGAGATLTIDPADYERDAINLPILGGTSDLEPNPCLSYYNVEMVLQEFKSINEEN